MLLRIRHLHGPKSIKCAKDDVLVTCVVRNGGVYIKSFIEHYLALGAKHIVFLDNDSEDETVSIARGHDHVTVVSSDAALLSDFKNEVILKQYLMSRFGRNRWCISADVDELFDYPFSDLIGLEALVEYLNANAYTAVLSQMLDLFPDGPIREFVNTKEDSVKAACPFYDISRIEKLDYFDALFQPHQGGNTLTNPDIKFHVGGIRRKLFGTGNWLTKHQLIFVKESKLTQPHWVSPVRCADFSAVCLHYKFFKDFHARTLAYLEDGYGPLEEYAAIADKLRKDPDARFADEKSEKFRCAAELVQNGFLVISGQYAEFARRHQTSAHARGATR